MATQHIWPWIQAVLRERENPNLENLKGLYREAGNTVSRKDHLPHGPWVGYGVWNYPRFLQRFNALAGVELTYCSQCYTFMHLADAAETINGDMVCPECFDNEYGRCDDCGAVDNNGNLMTIQDDQTKACYRCVDNLMYCQWCNRYYRRGNEEAHTHPDLVEAARLEQAERQRRIEERRAEQQRVEAERQAQANKAINGTCCSSSYPEFEFPFKDGMLAQNTRVKVELVADQIDQQGLNEISKLIRTSFLNDTNPVVRQQYYNATYKVFDLEPTWVTKEGKFPKRLAKTLSRSYGYKMPENVLTQVGNIAQQRIAACSTFYVELTRDLDQKREVFMNANSCWWSTQAISRCVFKTHGGIGLRTYANAEISADNPIGRTWIWPMKVVDGKLQHTHDSTTGTYLVFNPYGSVQGFVAPRIVAAMVGKTYKKITYRGTPMYMDAGSAYLIADQELCDTIRDMSETLPAHAELPPLEPKVTVKVRKPRAPRKKVEVPAVEAAA